MSEHGRVIDAFWNAKTDDERLDALAAYRHDCVHDFLCEVEHDLGAVDRTIADAKSAEGRMVYEWVKAILYRDRG